MKEINEKNLVPVKDIEVKTPLMEITRGMTPASFVLPRPDLAAKRLNSIVDGKVYLVNPEGYLQWIPDPSTYNNLFVNWDGIYNIDPANMPIGANLSVGAILATGSGGGKVYIVTNGKKRWITSPEVFNKYHFNWDAIYFVPQVLIDFIPTGNNWS